jgi:hypothetical protein
MTILSIKGTFQNGVAQPIEVVSGREGQTVIITFLDEVPQLESTDDQDSGWDQLLKIVDRNTMDTGVEDLATQHDHYLYGKPKQG